LYKAIHDLREKLEPDFDNPTYIEAISGYGYRFNGMLVRANSMSPIGLKARLMAHAEAAIGRLLAEKRSKPDLQSDDLGQLIDAAGQYVMERFTSELVGERE
jgi:DNA-binding winged helix-turn-helix (wHTH) protein